MMFLLGSFFTIFLSIILEALPFLLLGTLISSAINSFLSEDVIRRYLPKNRFFALLTASTFGLVLPFCECAIIPVAYRLMKKGLPPGVAVTFFLAAPIVNPISIASTLYAFNGRIEVAALRVCLGIVIAILVGWRVSMGDEGANDILKDEGGHDCCGETCATADHLSSGPSRALLYRTAAVFHHARGEFFEVSGVFIIGAFLSSLFNTFLPRDVLAVIGGQPILSTVVMMALAYVLSVCSESDAFLARSFSGTFSYSSLMGFMVFGPMLDLKNTLMMLHYFRRKFVLLVIVYVVAVNFIFAMLVHYGM